MGKSLRRLRGAGWGAGQQLPRLSRPPACCKLHVMPNDATFESFEKELNRLVETFGHRLAELKSTDYNEAKLRDDFLNPFFRALGWDMENRAGFIQKEREVEIESATRIGGGRKRADYLFRTDKHDRFICEAKKPAPQKIALYIRPGPASAVMMRQTGLIIEPGGPLPGRICH